MPDMYVVGFYFEPGRVVFVQSFEHPDGTVEQIEHAADSGEGAWRALREIAANPGAGARIDPSLDGPITPSDELMQIGLEGAQSVIASAAGPTAGRIASVLIRNPAKVRAAGERIANVVRSVSRGSRDPRGGGGRWG